MMLCTANVSDVFDQLTSCCSESPVGLGLISSRQSQSPTLVLTRDGDDGTSWSVVVVTDESACIAFTGESWQDVIVDSDGYE